MWAETKQRPHAECLSDLALDEWLAGDCSQTARASWEAHVAGCEFCRARREQREHFNRGYLERSSNLAALRPRLGPTANAGAPNTVHPLRSATYRRALVYASGAIAAAASVALLLTVSGENGVERTRRKGEARLGFYVKSGDTVREGAAGERVRAGDALRFVVPRGEARYVAVLGRDSRQVTSVYFPQGPLAVRVSEQAGEMLGAGVALDSSITLDDTPGIERFYGVFCDHAVATSTLGEELSRDGRLGPRAGCSIAETFISKQGTP
jgi:uncharacterized protein YfiM (DUF2279 family)